MGIPTVAARNTKNVQQFPALQSPQIRLIGSMKFSASPNQCAVSLSFPKVTDHVLPGRGDPPSMELVWSAPFLLLQSPCTYLYSLDLIPTQERRLSSLNSGEDHVPTVMVPECHVVLSKSRNCEGFLPLPNGSGVHRMINAVT